MAFVTGVTSSASWMRTSKRSMCQLRMAEEGAAPAEKPAAEKEAAPAKAAAAPAAEKKPAAPPPPPKKSASVPFLTQPKNLDGSYAGDVGFDPLGFSNYLSLKYLRESEIKHGRVAMLAALGILVQEIVHLPGKEFSNPVATDAWFQVPSGGLWQIFVAIGVAEYVGHRGKMTYMEMAEDKTREPGSMGFDPLNMSKNKTKDQMKKLELNEIKNGRLAMIGVGGLIHQMWISHQPTLYQLTHFKSLN